MKVRIANNKNIQTMEQKDIDIYEILKDVECGTELYTPMCGKVELRYLQDNKEAAEAIITNTNDGSEYTFNKNGKYVEEGEVLLFPSKEMRDWSKFFKKGDVLEHVDGNAHGICIFDSFEDGLTKLHFSGIYTLTKDVFSKYYQSFRTADWVKAENPGDYIELIEERLGGKLNLETLEIEKPAKPTFEIGKLYVFNDEDEDGKVSVIGKVIGKNESDGTLTFGEQYDIENEYFVTNETFYLNISLHKELREATELEAELFAKHRPIRLKEEKEAREQPDFKTFDKVLVRLGKEFKWLPAFFIRDRGESFTNRYNVLPLHTGKPADFTHCIPFEGHENIAFTSYDIENLPF